MIHQAKTAGNKSSWYLHLTVNVPVHIPRRSALLSVFFPLRLAYIIVEKPTDLSTFVTTALYFESKTRTGVFIRDNKLYFYWKKHT